MTTTSAFQRMHFIINPASGTRQPILHTINAALQETNVQWGIDITQPEKGAEHYVKQALDAGTDVIAVYGGDGTLHEAARALVGSPIPLCILPGGTSNALAKQLRIPHNLAEALKLALVPQPTVRAMDTCRIDDQPFVLNAGSDVYGQILSAADRTLKNQYGWLAYVVSSMVSSIRTVAQPQITHYRLTVDGEPVEQDAIACLVANVSSLGIPGLSISRNVSIDDGVLDVFLLDVSLQSILGGLGSLSGIEQLAEGLHHWQVRDAVHIEADPVQQFYVDGEQTPLAETPATIRIVPRSLRVVVPDTDGQ